MSLGDTPGAPPNGGPANGNQGLTNPTADSEDAKQVLEVLSSEIGIATMLTRLKQSIASAKEFAMFLKKRSILEDEHANGLKKLCRLSQDSVQRSEHLGGSFAKAYSQMMAIHDRMADNGMQYAMSLHQMNEDLLELAAIAEKSRKGWKQNGLMAEQRVADLEAAMRKSKAKYDALADEYDRVRTGDTSGKSNKMFGFKGPKSAAQHEEDVHRKVQAADQDYKGRVETYQTERQELISKSRPETVQALQEIVRECDSGLTLQMQKFASFNEKLLLSNGISISPLKNGGGDAISLRESILAINNEKDLNDYILAQHSKLPPRTGEPRYERNPVLDQSNRASGPSLSMPLHISSFGPGTSGSAVEALNSPVIPSPTGHTFGQTMSSAPSTISGSGPRPMSQIQPQHERSFSHGSIQNNSSSNRQQQPGPRNSYGQPQSQPSSTQGGGTRYNGSMGGGSTGPPMGSSQAASSQGPPQLGQLSFSGPLTSQPPTSYSPSHQAGPGSKPQQPPPQGLPSQGPSQGRGQSPPTMAPTRPVFGVALSRLYERDGLAVPMVVYQCIQAVDLYGLSVEGIYRLSGSVPHVNKLKNMFDTDSGSANLDFRNPENFFHDVNSVAGLLKQFFRDLPDPLLTKEHYSDFIEAAKHEDDTIRRDSLHAIINSLPDPNYATLRALALHLFRVTENSAVNRMTIQNLAIVFGPTLMGSAPGNNIQDAGWQVRVVDTILQNTYQIFDDD